jgi:tetrahydromethanopterin S-methyltransferase subunit G
MRNASNAVGRSIGRLLALVVVAILLIVAAMLSGFLPVTFAP